MTLRRALAVVAGGLVLLACAAEPAATPSSTTTEQRERATGDPAPTTTEAPTTTTVVLPEPEPVDWRACGGGLDCATVRVPVDYGDPHGERLDVALVRRPAREPALRIGTLLVNPGGPGASGVRRVARGFTVSPEVSDRFDVVGFDPRGVGDSAPVTCGATVAHFRATDLDPDSPAERDALEAAARAVADECARTEGARLAHLGTIEVAHDVEVIRRALGEPQLSYVGLSYGTLIGLLWAEAHPGSVRAMVLDGAVDPSLEGGVASAEQVEAVEDVLSSVDDRCAALPECPVAAEGGVLAAYDELARRVEAGSVPALGPTQLAYAAFYATYDQDLWPRFWDGLAAGLRGDGAPLSALASSFTRLVEYPPFAIVSCLDSRHPVGFDAWQAQADELARRSPRFGRTMANELLPCAWWPQSRYVARPVVAPGTPPVLVIGSTGDAATPFEAAQAVAGTLARGVLLTVDADGHVALGDSPCAAEAATRYLVDLAPPPPGTRC